MKINPDGIDYSILVSPEDLPSITEEQLIDILKQYSEKNDISYDSVNDKITWDEKTAHKSSTGSLRYNKDKLPVHLVPPSAIKAIAKVLEYGATKYAERNWESGTQYSVPYSSLMRHLLAWWQGEDKDSESGLPHTYHILMNAAMLVEYEGLEGDFDDRPKK